MKSFSLLIIGILFWHYADAQSGEEEHESRLLQDQIESYLDNLDESAEFEFTELSDILREYWQNPLSINHAGEAELSSLGILTDFQIRDLIEYREELGSLISLHELQSIPSFDERTIRLLLPFVTIRETVEKVKSDLKTMLNSGQDQVFIRWTRTMQRQNGFIASSAHGSPAYRGDPNQLYLRFRHYNQGKLSYGLTLEKDPGEQFISSDRKFLMDYSSAHFFIRDLNPTIRTIALGDYAVSFGQGLVAHSGFSTGKSSLVTKIKKGGRTLRPYSSLDESAFLRGIATTLSWGSISWTGFISSRNRDANKQTDTSAFSFGSFSSLQTSGLHRTVSEIEDRKSIQHTIVGSSLKYSHQRFTLSLNALYNKFDLPFERTARPYNLFRSRGRNSLNASLDYKYIYKNFHWFGEIAANDGGGLAVVNGLLVGLSRFADLALLHRTVDRRYDALQANAFLEASISSAESGMYLGTEIRLPRGLRLSLYADYWSHRWLRFQADAPSDGHEYFARLTYYKKRTLEFYAQYKSELKARNFRNAGDSFNKLFDGLRRSLRLHLNHKVSAALELRNRIEFSWAHPQPAIVSHGFLVYQDIIFRSLTFPISFAMRLSYFDTDDFASRIYAYENDVQSSFSIPAFSGEGFRYYLKLRGDLNRFMTLEIRWDQSNFRSNDEIGSGQDTILGNVRSRLKGQLRLTF